MKTSILSGPRIRGPIGVMAGTLLLFASASAQGIPEPPVLFYGSVVDNRTSANTLKTNGTLRVVLSAGTETNTYTTALQPIDGNNSYILALPAETPVAGFSDSANYLRLKSPPLTYTITEISLDGQKLFFQSPNSGSFQMNPDSRGLVRSLNLVMANVVDPIDQYGFSQSWKMQYFGTTGFVDPNADPDRDGKTNLQEFQAGTDPKERTFLNIVVLSTSPGKIRLSWESRPGVIYTVEQTGVVPFQSASPIQQNIPGQGQPLILELNIDPSGTQKFFRVKE